MKTCYVALITLAGFATISFAAYQQQGFVSYTESPDSTVSFTCAAQCFLLIGPIGYYDLMSINGLVQ